MPKILACYGTRPESIKMEPVVMALAEAGADVQTWFSGQSPDLVPGGSMPRWKSMQDGIALILEEMPLQYDAVLVQGDTATAFGCALAAFLAGVPVGHIEAGLRTYAAEPWPEEGFRRAIASLATWHFCPDEHSAHNICYEKQRSWGAENDREVFITGNPVIDTLPTDRMKVLVTLHRRENWGKRIADALETLHWWAERSGALVAVIEHPNWATALAGTSWREQWPQLYFDSPLDRDTFIEALSEADLIVTDSGGLQEECAALGVPCIVYRTATERTALARNGAVELVHPDKGDLAATLDRHSARRLAYGAGDAGAKIASILLKELDNAEAG